MSDWPFDAGKDIVGIPMLKLAEWAYESESETNVHTSTSRPQLALPPMQRNSVWRPKQVTDVWDSLIRGLPIGAFYLVNRSNNSAIVTLAGDTTTGQTGFDLLDGQQRLRCLLLGVYGFSKERRSLWIDLGKPEAKIHPVIHLTSKAQPFGYDAKTGRKLTLHDRQSARSRVEQRGVLTRSPDASVHDKPVYDRDLYDTAVFRNSEALEYPPVPFHASHNTFRFHELFRAWLAATPSDVDAGIAIFRQIAGEIPETDMLAVVHKAFLRIAKAEVALLRVKAENFDDPADVLELFQRIGAGGTALSEDERLYSIYKYHEPTIRDAVDEIDRDVGNVLVPTDIATTALRIANALSHPDRNDTPNVLTFASAMAEIPHSDLRNCLGKLLPKNTLQADPLLTLTRAFQTVKTLLSNDAHAGNFWIPDVLLASLPAELWQVLTFWAVQNPVPLDQEASREELVRFALFWNLCVFKKDPAARAAFAFLKDTSRTARTAKFPGLDLYKILIGESGADRFAHGLISAHDFTSKLCKRETESWRSDVERFGQSDNRNHIGSLWWASGSKMLPWLQRAYVSRMFPAYEPLSDHEDDLPYDIDHICPLNDWGADFRLLRNRISASEEIKTRIEHTRWSIGWGIGNLRVVESSENRKFQDCSVAEKMPFIRSKDPPAEQDLNTMRDCGFAPEEREVWNRASDIDGAPTWNAGRLGAFQQAVEERSAWLYTMYHNDLRYIEWTRSTQ